MRKIISFLILTTLSFFVSSHVSHAQKKRSSTPHAKGEDIYKHYTGTIGGKHVTLDLLYGFQGSSNYSGSNFYYSNSEGMGHFYVGEPETFEHNQLLTANEVPQKLKPGEGFFYDRHNPTPKWAFIISGKSLTGEWYSANRKDSSVINLEENYSNAYALDFVYFHDTAITTNRQGDRFKAEMSLMLVNPSPTVSKADADFINSCQLNFLKGDQMEAKNWDDFPKACSQKYFAEFDTKKDMLPVERYAINRNEGKHPSSFLKNIMFLPAYNDNGILVLKKEGFSNNFSGVFSHDSVSCLCLDVRNKKQLSLDDMLNVNNAKLSKLLEKAYREKYKLGPDKKLNSILKVNQMPVTRNIMPANKGLMFSYSANQLLLPDEKNTSTEPIIVYVSYRELNSMLKPGFKKRIGL